MVALAMLGAAIIVGGFYLYSTAVERIHTPMELWAARSIFGTRLNDGEHRPNVSLDYKLKLPAFPSINEELNAWHETFFTPTVISSDQLMALGLGELENTWSNTESRPIPHWNKTTEQKELPQSTAEFSIFLRDFVLGQSAWSATLSGGRKDSQVTTLPATPVCYLTYYGLVLNFKVDASTADEVILDVIYHPNQGLLDNTETQNRFKLER
jgi:hypothetical protein